MLSLLAKVSNIFFSQEIFSSLTCLDGIDFMWDWTHLNFLDPVECDGYLHIFVTCQVTPDVFVRGWTLLLFSTVKVEN